MVNTIAYYNKNVSNFIRTTTCVDFSETQNRFLNLLPPNATILDFGCGSGRDTKYFVFCEGDTEYNYIDKMRKRQDIHIALKPINMHGGGYSNFLR